MFPFYSNFHVKYTEVCTLPPAHSKIVLLHALEESVRTHFNHLAKCTGPADRGHTRVHYVLLIIELYYTLI